jgi:hypothetical protein
MPTDIESLKLAVAANPDEETPTAMLSDAYREAGEHGKADAVLTMFRIRKAVNDALPLFARSVAQLAPAVLLLADSFKAAAQQMTVACTAACSLAFPPKENP